MVNLKVKSQDNPENLYIALIGGLGEFGMNSAALIYQSNLYFIDFGIQFASEHLIGIDAVYPCIDDLVQPFGKVSAYIITHGHEDHIGALPFVLNRWPARVFSTKWTAMLLEHKGNFGKFVNIISGGDSVQIDGIKFTWIPVNHSIPMACGIEIETMHQRIFHSGDFKIDLSSKFEPTCAFNPRDNEFDLVMADSTNAGNKGWSGSEAQITTSIAKYLESESQVVVATFSSNLWRILSFLEAAHQKGRKVLICGSGLHKTISIARQLDMIPRKLESVIIEDSNLQHTPREQLLIITTGCQGESQAALFRIISKTHKTISLRKGDLVILSSRIIPGNEVAVYKMISLCNKEGIKVISTKTHPKIHVSGHAHSEELVHLIEKMKTKALLPIHGTFTQLKQNEVLGSQSDIQTIDAQTGDIVVVERNGSVSIDNKFQLKQLYVDSWSRIPMEKNLIRQRHKIGDSGLVIATGVFNPKFARWNKAFKLKYIGTRLPDNTDLNAINEELLLQLEQNISCNDSEASINDFMERTIKRKMTEYLVKKPVVICNIYCPD